MEPEHDDSYEAMIRNGIKEILSDINHTTYSADEYKAMVTNRVKSYLMTHGFGSDTSFSMEGGIMNMVVSHKPGSGAFPTRIAAPILGLHNIMTDFSILHSIDPIRIGNLFNQFSKYKQDIFSVKQLSPSGEHAFRKLLTIDELSERFKRSITERELYNSGVPQDIILSLGTEVHCGYMLTEILSQIRDSVSMTLWSEGCVVRLNRVRFFDQVVDLPEGMFW